MAFQLSFYPLCHRANWLRRIVGMAACWLLVVACDNELEPSDPAVAQCDAFDERCLHCEETGVGATCEVEGKTGQCIEMRIIQGPQVYISGLRCRAD